ncbi:MAG: cation:proton antiporter domain-containing protein [Oceanococcus sp.]
MSMDPLVIYFVISAIAVLFSGMLMRWLRQPMITGYILAGFALGPHALGLVSNQSVVEQLGAVGVVLLLFFIGMETSPVKMVRNWRVAIFGTLLQVFVSMGIVALLGLWFDWPLARTVLIGMVASLSCTAIVIDHLSRRGQMDTQVAQDTLGILIAQDIFVIPMIIVLGMLSGESIDLHVLALQLSGGSLVLAFAAWVLTRENFEIPWITGLADNAEMQVFISLLLCFGLAFVTGIFQLSTALGAFVAGMIVAKTTSSGWIRLNLEPLRIVFVAIFFASIGMLLDTKFLIQYWQEVLLLVVTVLLTNTIINACILRLLGRRWPESFYAGALLAHVGEFSFVLAAVGYNSQIVGSTAYQITVAVIALSLSLGPAWASIIERCLPKGALSKAEDTE